MGKESEDQAAEPEDPEPEPSDDEAAKNFAGSLNTAAVDLKAELSVDESGFRFIAAQAHSNLRDYFVFEALDDIQKAIFFDFEVLERLSGEELDPADPYARTMYEWTESETALWQRKLIELLADLIGFSATPDEIYFRDYLYLIELNQGLSAQADQDQFYGSKSKNWEFRINELCQEIAKLEEDGLDPGTAWYRHKRVPLAPRSELRPGQLIASFRRRYLHSAPIATDQEKGPLGFTYGAGFGRASEGVHASPGVMSGPVTTKKLRADLNVLMVMAMTLLVRCQMTIGKVPDGANRWAADGINQSDAKKIANARLRGRAKVNDLVVVDDKVGKVLEVASGQFGYESYRVRYLSKPFLPEIPDDWHTAGQVARLRSPQTIRAEIQADQDSGRLAQEPAEMLLALDDDKLTDYFGGSIATLWEAGVGLKEYVLKQVRKDD